MDLKEYEYLWQPGSIYYAERVSRYGYVIITCPQTPSKDRMVLIIEDDDIYKAVVDKMLDEGRGIDCGRWREDECTECVLREGRRDELIFCPKCHEKSLHYTADFGGVSYLCKSCGEGAATSYFPPCSIDDELYGLAILDASVLSLNQIKAVGKIFRYRYNQIYTDIRSGRTVEIRGSLRELAKMEMALNVSGISCKISPKPPYSQYHHCVEAGICI